ncbi:major facilitator superfamily domain-containing protein [Emericellopsis atlantica]|uniref:Major facilitator superfamily domain-containing protein n=1 Tax=Emericellopsis atlantica TaxID=2614577 RepID=A0A9P7ZPP3_9HYPO|nr:major facilitator superfamily domain-containing protein [Emericellopsis atlantica]KAG9255527.1 major facilitator superfamily domain-containing protein [Emericellopsis atlantica]
MVDHEKADELSVSVDSRRGSETSQRETWQNDKSARAWVVVAGAFLWMMVSQGVLLIHGLLIAELDNHFGADPKHTWLSGIASFVAMVSTPFLGVVMDTFGPILMGCVAVVSTVGVFIALSLCTGFGHLVAVFTWHGITLGMCIAIGPSMAGKLFQKRGGLAQGITMCGSSLAGIIYAASFRSMYGDSWRTGNQIFAVVTGSIAVLALGATYFFNRVVPDELKVAPGQGWKTFKSQIEGLVLITKLFTKNTWERNAPYAWFVGGSFFLQFGIFGASASVPFIARAVGATETDAQYCLIALSSASFVGRLMSGFIADSMGSLMLLFWTCIAEVVVLLGVDIALADRGAMPLYFASTTWGFFSGCWVPLFAACIGKLSDPKDLGKFLGISNLVISPACLLAAPLMRYILECGTPRLLYGSIASFIIVGAAMVYRARMCKFDQRFASL